MADLAYDASGPASSEPAGIAQQQANRPASPEKEKLRVFISYSRDDLDFADQLAAALDFSGFECVIDREGISGGEAWKRRLGNLIGEADTVVFVLSPSSARSETCDWEVEEASRLNKRILPVICRPVEDVSPPLRLRDINYIFFYKEPKVPGSGFGTGLANLVTALNTDFDWLREHTRYLQRAIEWDTGGRPTNRLLSGNDILEANAWAARRPKGAPEPTALQLNFIRASEEEAEARLSEQRKQLEAVAAAQAAREKALHEAEEALKQAADAQRRRARIRNVALIVVSILAVLSGWLGWSAVEDSKLAEQQRIIAEEQRTLAEQQRKTAEQQTRLAEQDRMRAEAQTRLAEEERMTAQIAFAQQAEQRHQADAILARVTNIISNLQKAMDSETKHEAFALFQAGAEHGNAVSMSNLGIAYQSGLGVPQDYAKAREWYEKAAAKGEAVAMADLGVLYRDGQGVPQDYLKAREWFEKAAAKDNVPAMAYLGALYANGLGVTPDYDKAREWWEKAAAKDNASAKEALERLSIREAEAAGQYDEALRLNEVFAAKIEAEETKRDGRPGEQTAGELLNVTWYALFAKDYMKALAVADRAHALFPDNIGIEGNRAHALMFLGHDEEAKALYLANKGKPVAGSGGELWEQAIADDFAEFRKAGLTHPMMDDVEKELGISR